MKNYNEELAAAFYEISELMSIINENPFKIRAYQVAARRLKEEFRPITKKDTNKKVLMAIPGIGPALSEKIIQYIKDGKINYLEKLRQEIPKPVQDLLKVPHLGPRRVRDLYVNLGIKSKEDLIRHAKNGDIADMRGFGEKLISQILKAIEGGQEKKKRHERKEVAPIAKKLIGLIQKIKGVKKVEVAGSYRRGAETVGDLDILVVGIPSVVPTAEKQILRAFPDITILASGETKVAFLLVPQNLQVDIRFVPEESYGAALLYFTGNKDFNVKMRKIAIEKGYLLNEYGMFESGEYIVGKTEKEVFEKLGMKPVLPKNRK